jgi:hypothetical protein
VGSIPIARSTFHCLACPCVVLGRDLACRPVPISMRASARNPPCRHRVYELAAIAGVHLEDYNAPCLTNQRGGGYEH